jgi:hypothetical protein
MTKAFEANEGIKTQSDINFEKELLKDINALILIAGYWRECNHNNNTYPKALELEKTILPFLLQRVNIYMVADISLSVVGFKHTSVKYIFRFYSFITPTPRLICKNLLNYSLDNYYQVFKGWHKNSIYFYDQEYNLLSNNNFANEFDKNKRLFCFCPTEEIDQADLPKKITSIKLPTPT